MKITRTITNITFSETELEELRTNIKKDLIDEQGDFTEYEVEERLKEKCMELAKDRTMYDQGDNSLHHDISYELIEE